MNVWRKVSYLKPQTIVQIHLVKFANSRKFVWLFFSARKSISCVPNTAFFGLYYQKIKGKCKRYIRFIVVVNWWKNFLVPKNICMWLFFHSNRIALRNNNVVGFVKSMQVVDIQRNCSSQITGFHIWANNLQSAILISWIFFCKQYKIFNRKTATNIWFFSSFFLKKKDEGKSEHNMAANWSIISVGEKERIYIKMFS